MTKRQTRAFFLGSTLLFAAVFLWLTFDSHRKFPELTHSQNLTPEVLAGKQVWHEKNCTNCHTLLGEGAYYAPDLTKIAQQRGAGYLSEFLKDPSKFYSEEKDRRLMPAQNLREDQIQHLIAFLTWVSHIDTGGWPPRPLLVAGTFPGTQADRGATSAASNDPIALGEALFRRATPGCFACHSTATGVQLVGPSLAGLATRAAQTIQSSDYHGEARSADAYVRESILHPSAYLVAGPTFSAAGRSFMPDNMQTLLKPQEVDQIVAYLMTLK